MMVVSAVVVAVVVVVVVRVVVVVVVVVIVVLVIVIVMQEERQFEFDLSLGGPFRFGQIQFQFGFQVHCFLECSLHCRQTILFFHDIHLKLLHQLLRGPVRHCYVLGKDGGGVKVLRR